MSTTSSSSDCDCDDYCHYSAGFSENIYRKKMFPTMAHPLIYYSQINPVFPPQPRRQRSRKGNPNCFVKAFRWYTQEHVPFSDGTSNARPNMNEFASWMDTKYNEFIQSRPQDQNSYRLTLKQTSIITAEKNPNSNCGGCSSNKTKFKRFKSPWTKRQRRKCSREGTPMDNNTQSFQYILQPKDLSRPNSCCQSSINTPSTETQKKIVIKSQSLTNFTREQSGTETVDTITTQEGINQNITLLERKPYLQAPTISTLNDMSCQCTIADIEKMDVGTQCDDLYIETKNTSILKSYNSTSFKSTLSNESKLEKELKVSYSTHDMTCQCSIDDKDNSKNTVKNVTKGSSKTPPTSSTETKTLCKPPDPVPCDCQPSVPVKTIAICECPPKPVETKNACPCSTAIPTVIKEDASTQYERQPSSGDDVKTCSSHVSQTVNTTPRRKCICEESIGFDPDPIVENGAQTSDHCIVFDTNAPYTYPLFMKIVCADKLN